jgi:formiminotetrahydrofolate cyclodeaminase
MKTPLKPAVQTPFDSVENAQTYIQLLIETLVEAKKEVAEDAAAAATRSERRLEALRLVEYKLHRLEHHLRISGRMLNDLRRLRRLLLDEVSRLDQPPAA